MPRKETLTNVPANEVEQVVQDFKDAGATDVQKTEDPKGSGKYTVVATFPDAPDKGKPGATPGNRKPASPKSSSTSTDVSPSGSTSRSDATAPKPSTGGSSAKT